MRFIGHSYAEQPADLERCLVEVSSGRYGMTVTQCQRKPLEGKLRCKQHEEKDAPIVDDDPIIARIALGEHKFIRLEKRRWFGGKKGRITDPILSAALDRIAALEASPNASADA